MVKIKSCAIRVLGAIFLINPQILMAQEIMIRCDGESRSLLIDYAAADPSRVLRVQDLPSKAETKAFIIKGKSLIRSDSESVIQNCKIDEASIKCDRPKSEFLPRMFISFQLSIDRVSGVIRDEFLTTTYGGRVNGIESFQQMSSHFNGQCKRLSEKAF